MRFVRFDKRLFLKRSCPYCKANESVTATGWTLDENRYPRKLKKKLKKAGQWPLWVADCFDIECTKMPDFDSLEFDAWNEVHDDPMPYVNFMPHQIAVEKLFARRVRYYENKNHIHARP